MDCAAGGYGNGGGDDEDIQSEEPRLGECAPGDGGQGHGGA